MAVTILTEEQKQRAHYLVKNDGATLTDVAKHLGVSRQTIRRVVEEIEKATAVVGFEKRPEPKPVKVRIIKDKCSYAFGPDMDFDKIFDAVVTDDPERFYSISAKDLMDAGGRWFSKLGYYNFDPVWVDVVEKQITGKFKVGDLVTIKPTSKYHNKSRTNPDCSVVGKIIKQDGSLPITVEWSEGLYNNYKHSDLDLFASLIVEEEAFDKVIGVDLAEHVHPVVDNAQYFFNAPQDSISIVRVEDGAVETRNINKDSAQFITLRGKLRLNQDQNTLREVFTLMDTKATIKAFSVGRVKVDAEDETVVFVKADGTERKVPEELAGDIISTVKDYGQDQSEKLVKFLDKLMDNPSFSAIEGLYRFMKHNCIEINDDGSIHAWKGVERDLYSKRGGDLKSTDTITVDSRGRVYNGDFNKEIRVDRSEVDDNPDNTCSKGLHVGNREYASQWAPVLLPVRVEPQDVVAVPKDYNGAKMRTCAYTPLYTA